MTRAGRRFPPSPTLWRGVVFCPVITELSIIGSAKGDGL